MSQSSTSVVKRGECVELDMEAIQIGEHDAHPAHHELMVAPLLNHNLA